MKRSILRITAGLVFAGGAAAPALAGGSDTFNRPTLGPSWVDTSGTLSISHDELVGTTGTLGYYKASAKDTAASATIFLTSTDLEYGAIALGNIGGNNNAFVKIQSQNGGGTFDHAAFYTGNNGGGNFFTLSSAVSSPAIIDVFFCGTTATLRITSANGAVQTYSNNYNTTFGAGAGAGTFGSVAIDNFVGFKSGCKDLANAKRAEDMPRDIDRSLSR